jgi:hypothetical protein
MMRNIPSRWPVVGILLTLGLWVLLLWPVGGLADGPGPRIPGRELAPIVVQGGDVAGLLGAPGDALHVYAYRDGEMRQIPHQVDHVTAQGDYTSTVGLSLGAADEIVFMAADMGDMTPPEVSAALPISSPWYEIQATDPLSPTLVGWAYLVRTSAPIPALIEPYVAYDPETREIRTSRYALGFAEEHVGFDVLRLFGSEVDILDRTKIRLQTLLGEVTEDYLGPEPIDLIKDGPVRVVARGGSVMGYSGMVLLNLRFELPASVTAGRVSTDWSSAASGSMLYNAVAPEGVLIDGQPDAMPAQPVSPWWQVTGPTGTVVQVVDPSGVGGSLSNYYLDDDALNPSDPGDNRSYGDIGITAVGPNRTVTLSMGWWFLETDEPNVGLKVAAHAANPLQIKISEQWRGQPLFLPLVLR